MSNRLNPVEVGDVLERAHRGERHDELNALVRRLLRLGSPSMGTWPLAPSWRQRWRCATYVGHCWHVLSGMGLEWVCCVCTVEREHPGPPDRCRLCAWPSWLR